MELQGKVKLKFGGPEHGWLDMTLSCGEFQLKLDISDVPVDSLDLMRIAILNLSNEYYNAYGIQEVILHLEPTCYYLDFERNNENYRISISTSEDYNNGKKTHLHSISGTFNDIIMPVYRGLMEFYSFNYQEPNWRATDRRLIEKLKAEIKTVHNNT